MPTLVHITDLDDPRLADYRGVKDRQWLPEFSPARAPRSGDPAAPWGKFMAEGETVLHKLTERPHLALSVLCTPVRLEAARPWLDRFAPDLPVYILPQDQLERVVGFTLHRGLMAVAARPRPLTPDDVLTHTAPGRPLVILESVFNHDNIGGAFRCAAALGASGVILSPRCADPLYRKALRVSVGTVLLTPWAYASPWPEALSRLRANGVAVLAMTLSPSAIPLARAVADPALAGRRLAILLGSEGPGLTPEASDQADLHVRIPIAPVVDSLNVATTAGIALAALATPPV